MPAPSGMQATYAELSARCEASAFDHALSTEGAFVVKSIKDRRYWYFQTSTARGRIQRYVGPETPELLERVHQHRQARDAEKQRRALVAALTRSFGLPAPIAPVGDVVAALARAGVFRSRGVLLGTVAYQSYPAILGVKLSRALFQTGDVGIAQLASVAVAAGERTPAPMLEVLRGVDRTFREIAHDAGNRHTTRYIGKGGLRIEFVTLSEGPDTDLPPNLPASSAAQPLRYLDFLVREPVSALMLHGSGIPVVVPAPERFAVHRLILAPERPPGVAQRDEDVAQAEALVLALIDKRPQQLRSAWEEACERGPQWRKQALGGMQQLSSRARDLLLRALAQPRDILPGMNLTFRGAPPRYEANSDVVSFSGEALGRPVRCAVSRQALDDHFDTDGRDKRGRLESFRRSRAKIERMVTSKYLSWPVEEPDTVVLTATDVERLSRG